MDFFSLTNRPKTIDYPECEVERPIYLEKIDKHGHTYLEQTGVEPFVENIQKFKSDCDIYTILKRYEAGDPNIVARLDKSFGNGEIDITNLPDNILDLKNALKQAEVLFDSLTPTERKAYDNNVNVFLADVVKGNLPDTLAKIINPKVDEVVEVSAPVEQKPAEVEGVKYE